MNLLFLTGKTGGQLFVVNMQIVRSIDLTPSTKYTNVGIEYENESAAEYDVLETPAQIRAQLERMANPRVPIPNTTNCFVCPVCHGTSAQPLGEGVLCLGCRNLLTYDRALGAFITTS